MPVIINRKDVTSSTIHSVGYDGAGQILEVRFWKGRKEERVPGDVYRYFDVPEKEHENLMKAESVGKYFHAHIRNNYRFEKI